MLTAFLVASALADLPFPISELDLEEKQSKGISRVLDQYSQRIKPLESSKSKAKGKQQEKLEADISKLISKRDDEIAKVLTDDQREKLALYREKGVPISDGFYRTSPLRVAFHTTGGGQTVGIAAFARGVQEGAGKSSFKIQATCDLKNLSGTDFEDVRFVLQILDKSGKEVGTESVYFEDFTNGKTVKFNVVFTTEFGNLPECKLVLKETVRKR